MHCVGFFFLFLAPCLAVLQYAPEQYFPGLWMHVFRETSPSSVKVILALYNVTTGDPPFSASATITAPSNLTVQSPLQFESSTIDHANQIVYTITDIIFLDSTSTPRAAQRHVHAFSYANPKMPTALPTKTTECPLKPKDPETPVCVFVAQGNIWAINAPKKGSVGSSYFELYTSSGGSVSCKASNDVRTTYPITSGNCPSVSSGGTTNAYFTSSNSDGSLIQLAIPQPSGAPVPNGKVTRTRGLNSAATRLSVYTAQSSPALWVFAATDWQPLIEVFETAEQTDPTLFFAWNGASSFKGPMALDSTKTVEGNDILLYQSGSEVYGYNVHGVTAEQKNFQIRGTLLPFPSDCSTNCHRENSILYAQDKRFPIPHPPSPPPPSPPPPPPSPTPPKKKGVDPGWFIVIAMFAIAILYFGIGTIVMKVKNRDEKNILMLIPQREYWIMGYGLVKDGVLFAGSSIQALFSKCKKGGEEAESISPSSPSHAPSAQAGQNKWVGSSTEQEGEKLL